MDRDVINPEEVALALENARLKERITELYSETVRLKSELGLLQLQYQSISEDLQKVREYLNKL